MDPYGSPYITKGQFQAALASPARDILGLFRDYIRIMENRMETTIKGVRPSHLFEVFIF